MIIACKSKKETVSATAAADPLRPGDAELAAVKDKFPGITTEQLSDGYAVYTVACTNCHGKKNIYSRTEEEWTKAINRMAPKAKITEEQKDHLTKYIFAMKASHPGQKK
jgi:mono/diheme cytochrome c family protein